MIFSLQTLYAICAKPQVCLSKLALNHPFLDQGDIEKVSFAKQSDAKGS